MTVDVGGGGEAVDVKEGCGMVAVGAGLFLPQAANSETSIMMKIETRIFRRKVLLICPIIHASYTLESGTIVMAELDESPNPICDIMNLQKQSIISKM